MIIEHLPFYDVTIDAGAPGAEVAAIFDRDQKLPGIVITHAGPTPAVVTRHRFYQRLGRLYGVEIYMPRPIAFYLETEAEQPLILPGNTPVQKAVVACLARGDSVYDPFLVTVPGAPARLVTFEALILHQTELLSVAQMEAQAQRARS